MLLRPQRADEQLVELPEIPQDGQGGPALASLGDDGGRLCI